MNKNEDKLIRPVYVLRSVLRSAVAEPMRIPACFSDFGPQEGGQRQNLCGFCTWNYFPKLPAWSLYEARACSSA